ncbi:exosortase/archaeosortase family protein [Marinobacter sp.]|uniref:exosortase/archaeosortase family protein n=1 Tax=Marinobacter sp. TaxID=50741 RepID=UPI00385137A7
MLRKIIHQFPLARPYLIATAIGVVLFFPTWLRLAGEWLEWEQVIAHGLPTFLIYLGLILYHPPIPNSQVTHGLSLLGGIALLAVTLVWAMLELVRIDTLAYLMLPAGVGATVWALLGLRALVAFIPYLLLLSLSLPFWADLVPPLVSLASLVVGDFVRLFGMTALIEGSSITLPYGRLVIADGCSGIRYFAISILLAMMTSILNDYRWKGWAITLAAGIALGLLVNWVRIAALVAIAYETNMESSLMDDHETFGWLVYAVIVGPALWFAPVLRRDGNAPAHSPERIHRRGLIFVAVAFVVGTAGITMAHSVGNGHSPWHFSGAGFSGSTDLPAQISASSLPLQIRLPDSLELRAWRLQDGVFASLVQTQRTTAGDKLVPYLPAPIDRDEWNLESEHANGRVSVYRNIASRKQVAFSKWYQVGKHRTDSYREAKLLQIPAILSGETRFAMVVLQASCGSRSCDRAVATLVELEGNLGLEAPKQ